MMYELKRFAIVKIDEENELFKIEVEGDSFWIPLHIASLGLYPPKFDWNMPGAHCKDEDHRYVEIQKPKFNVRGKFVYEHFGTDEMVIAIDKYYLLTGEYRLEVISQVSGLSPPHNIIPKKTTLRSKKDRIEVAETYLNQELGGDCICLEKIGELDDCFILQDVISKVVFFIKEEFLKVSK